jgi:hypothetical protein
MEFHDARPAEAEYFDDTRCLAESGPCPELRLRQMTRWRKAVFIAAAVELPLIVMLALQARLIRVGAESLAQLLLLWYHIVPLSIVTFGWLWLFGHGAPAAAPIWVYTDWQFALIYSGQVAVTTPIAVRCRIRKD